MDTNGHEWGKGEGEDGTVPGLGVTHVPVCTQDSTGLREAGGELKQNRPIPILSIQ